MIPTTRVAGSGATRSDCYAALEVVGAPTVVRDKRVECVNGDPACDLDGDPCDGACTIGVALCLNEPEGSSTCIPPFPPDPLVRVKTRKDAKVLEVPPMDAVGCGAVSEIEVRLRSARGGRVMKPGKARLKVIAVSPKRPRRDRDKVLLVCLPPEQGCGP